MSAIETGRSTATVRIFAMAQHALTPIPRRGAVKTWTGLTERAIAAAVVGAQGKAQAPQGLLELSLRLDEGGDLVGVRISTSSGSASVDANCIKALRSAAPLLPPPAQVRDAEVVVLVEFAANPAV